MRQYDAKLRGVGTAAILLISVFLTPNAGCQEPSAEGLKQWLVEEYDRAVNYKLPRNIKVTWSGVGLPATDDQLMPWRQAAAGKPEHPYNQRIAAHERRRKEGPDRGRSVFWYVSDEQWRFSVDVPYTPERYIDYAVDHGTSWVLTANRASFFEAESRTAEVPPTDKLNQAHDDFNLIAKWGRFPKLLTDPRTCRVTASVSDGLGVAELKTTDDWLVRCELLWKPDARLFQFTKIQVFPPGRTTPTIQNAFFDPRYDELLGITVPTRVRHTLGFEEEDVIYEGSERIDPDSLGRLFAVPEPKTIDPIRGEVNVKAISDYRPGRNVMRVLGGDHPREMALPPQPISHSKVFRVVGWVAAGAILGGLVYLRVRRAARTRLRTVKSSRGVQS